jgi:hypothetical protein
MNKIKDIELKPNFYFLFVFPLKKILMIFFSAVKTKKILDFGLLVKI